MDLINTCFEMCDYIEQNGVVRLAGNVKLRDNLKKELLHFLIYISMTDGRYGEEEKAFIKKKLGFDVSKDSDFGKAAIAVANDMELENDSHIYDFAGVKTLMYY